MGNLAANNLINSCINIEQKRISRRRTIPENISFNLNRDILSQITTLRNNRQKLYFSSDNLAELRYYFLLNIAKRSQLGIAFKTYYEQESKVAIIQSIINLSGTAEQYIRSDALEQKEIISSHYWLINQILNQIPLKYKKSRSKVFWGLSGSIIIFFGCLIFLFIPVSFWIKVLIFLVFTVFTLKILPILFEKYLYSWILEQLLFGFLSSSLKRKKIGLNLLEILNN